MLKNPNQTMEDLQRLSRALNAALEQTALSKQFTEIRQATHPTDTSSVPDR